MDLIVSATSKEVDFNVRELPCSEVVGFELSVDADSPVCVVVEETEVVEYTGLRDVVVLEAVGDGEVAEVDGVGVFAGVGDTEAGTSASQNFLLQNVSRRKGTMNLGTRFCLLWNVECFVGTGDCDEAGEDGSFVNLSWRERRWGKGDRELMGLAGCEGDG
jgi:hypothetical protein